jgi:hypothetical protein
VLLAGLLGLVGLGTVGPVRSGFVSLLQAASDTDAPDEDGAADSETPPDDGDGDDPPDEEGESDEGDEGEEGEPTSGEEEEVGEEAGEGEDGPDTTITAGPPRHTKATEAKFKFESSERDATFECRLDDGDWETCESPLSLSDLSEGSHSFEVRALGVAEAPDATPATHQWTVNPTGPPLTITSPKEGETVDPTPVIEGAAEARLSPSDEPDAEDTDEPGGKGGDEPSTESDDGKPGGGKPDDRGAPKSDDADSTGPGSLTIRIYRGDAPEGEPVETLTTESEDGRWKAEVRSPLPKGTYTAQVEQADGAEGEALSEPTTFTVAALQTTLRTQNFDSDPNWDGENNRLVPSSCPSTSQNFGASATNWAGTSPGEVGGVVWNSYTPAHFGKVLPQTKTLNDSLSASGSLYIKRGGSFNTGKGLHAGGPLFGFFNHDSQDWRTPNSLVFRLEEDGAPGLFKVGPEYANRRYEAGPNVSLQSDGGAPHLQTGRKYKWKLTYSPTAARKRGQVEFSIEKVGRIKLDLLDGHKGVGAEFDRFGLINRMIEGNEVEVYYDDLVINGASEPIGGAGPVGWDGRGSQTTFSDCVIDDRHDFGYTGNGGVRQPGVEVPANAAGGVFWRTESTDRGLSAYYGDDIGSLDLEQELHAEGKVVLDRASSDSHVNFGFFNSTSEDFGETVPHDFVGISTDGPSRAGYYFRPAARASTGDVLRPSSGPTVLPDGGTHNWTLDYVPTSDGGGKVTMTLDGKELTQVISPADRAAGATLDRFGMRNVTRGGHAQILYLDELTYTAASELTATSNEQADTSIETLGGETGPLEEGTRPPKDDASPAKGRSGK